MSLEKKEEELMVMVTPGVRLRDTIRESLTKFSKFPKISQK